MTIQEKKISNLEKQADKIMRMKGVSSAQKYEAFTRIAKKIERIEEGNYSKIKLKKVASDRHLVYKFENIIDEIQYG